MVNLTDEQIKQIAREFGRTKDGIQLGEELGVPTGKVRAIVSRLRHYGVNIPKMHYSKYALLTKELKKENPELFEKTE